jgi:transketolase
MAEGSMGGIRARCALRLDNLTAIADVNRLGQRGETMVGRDTGILAERARAFGWHAIEVDGHDAEEIDRAYHDAAALTGRPTAILARTLKGKGVAAVEDKEGWHGKPLDDPDAAIAELGGVRSLRLEERLPEPGVPHRFETRPLELPRYELGTEVATRKAYGDALAALGAARGDVVVLDGEVSNSTFAEIFKNAHPERYFEMYIAEQQLIAAAVGSGTWLAAVARARGVPQPLRLRPDGGHQPRTMCSSGSHAASRSAKTGRHRWRSRTRLAASVHGLRSSTRATNQTAKLVAAMADLEGTPTSARCGRRRRCSTPGRGVEGLAKLRCARRRRRSRSSPPASRFTNR